MEGLKAENNELKRQMSLLEQRLNQIQILGGNTALNYIPTPEKFSFEPSDWSKWLTNYERCRSVAGLTNLPEKTQVDSLLLHMGPEVNQLIDNVTPTPEQMSSYETMVDFFNDYFVKKVNVIYERAKFNQRTQKDGETAQEFIASILSLSKTCNYGIMTDELIRDKLVVGIGDVKLSETLQMDSDLTLQTAKTKILQNERIKQQNKELRGKPTHEVNRLTKSNNKNKTKKNSNEYPQCGRCGRKPSHELKDCPAVKYYCNTCKAKGHFSKMCRSNNKKIASKSKKHVREVQDSSEATNSTDDEVGEIVLELKEAKVLLGL